MNFTYGRLYNRENGDIFPTDFSAPEQVLFFESEEISDCPRWIGGIAFGETVICGECGGTIELSELDKLFVFDSWIDISENIGDGGITVIDEQLGKIQLRNPDEDKMETFYFNLSDNEDQSN